MPLNTRKAPDISAKDCPEGTIEWGNDKERWVVTKTETGVKRWTPYHSAHLFGYAPLTAKILEKNINKPITVYERQSQSFWPESRRDFDVKYVFTASGDVELPRKKKILLNWLKTRTPAVKENDLFIISGTLKSNDIDATIQVAPLPNELVSSNLMNTDAFIKYVV